VWVCMGGVVYTQDQKTLKKDVGIADQQKPWKQGRVKQFSI